ncbi:MAG: hypothetical protein Q8O57_14210 [Kiritimatiellota bacterium]|nr:hypothetical protein [Kiritimatiellota bacterium]
MNTKPPEKVPAHLPKDPFAYIGFWQFLTFIMLILIVWVNEVKDMPALLFNTDPQDINIFRGCLLTAAVLVAAIVAIGNTYLQQKRVLNSMISVCSSCNKVRINQHQWKQMEEYISDNSLLTFTHGLCPDCMEKVMQTINQRTAERNS